MKNILFTLFILLEIIGYGYAQPRKETFRLVLKDNWKMQSAVTDPSSANEISSENFSTARWYPVSIPTTIIGGLLANKFYNFDPFFGQNFKKLDDPKLDKTWWLRKEFLLPQTEKGKSVVLKLHGINYKANVWLNGTKIADSADTKGPFRIIQLDVTKQIHYTSKNILLLEILRPFNPNKENGDLAIDYADWIHYPPDYNGGVVNDIEIKTFDRAGVQFPLVTTKFDLPSLDVAHLTVDAQVTNYVNDETNLVIRGDIDGTVNFEKQVHLLPREVKNITFTPDEYVQLNVKNPKIWWPWQYGKPELSRITIKAIVNDKVSNAISENFGIRQITSEFIDSRSRVFLVNGKRILIRGGAWSPDIFQRRSAERQEQEIRLARDMNMNLIRSEGKMEDDHFYDLCDQYGMLVMSGWMCCGTWQYPKNWDPAERNIAMASDSSVMYWLRNKASLMAWLNGSDMPPTDTTVERGYLNIEQSLKWPNPILATANAGESKVSGLSGVKMAGPYDWVPPVYWETDDLKKFGGTWSFATEISPGPSIPPYESLIKFLPKDSTNTSADWLYHCGTQSFGTTNLFDAALKNRYGVSLTLKNYAAKAQAQNYEAHRAMMEAYGLNKYQTATGVIQWMMSNPWPSVIWHTYDYYLYPAGTYFGMKKAMEPLHIMYSYKSHEVAIVNSFLEKFEKVRVKATVYDINGIEKYQNTATISVGPDTSLKCFAIPEVTGISDVYFIRLEALGPYGKVNSINWYWISKKADVLNWAKSNWYHTPQDSYADYTSLGSMKKTSLKVQKRLQRNQDSIQHTLTITNTGKTVAFFVHLRALKGDTSEDILPVKFSDNYLLLAPQETRTVTCSYALKDAQGKNARFNVSAWNIDLRKSAGKDVVFTNELPK